MGEVIRLDTTRAVELASRNYGFTENNNTPLRGSIHLDQLILGKVKNWFSRKGIVDNVVDNVFYVDFQRNYWIDLVEYQFFLMETFKESSNPEINYVEPTTFSARQMTLDEYVAKECPELINHIALAYSPSLASVLCDRLEEFKKEVYGNLKLVK